MKKTLSYLRTRLGSILLAGSYVPLSHFTPLESAKNSPMLTPFYTSANLPGLINGMFKLALSVGAILAVLRLAQAGFLYMGSSDMWGEKAHAKEIIRNAVMGLLLLMSIYIILYQINPDIVSLKILDTIKSHPAQLQAPSTPSQNQ